tara:strand:+ start:28856 stop:29437 length:582 start_codon:yes stop_codon:yes gene_type:complete
MILFLNEDGELQLTEKALMIKGFSRLRDYAREQYNVGMVTTIFSVLHLMYDYDSSYLYDHPDEVERLKAVRAAVEGGKDFKMTRTVKEGMELYKTLYEKEQVSSYMVLKRNFFRLKNYADSMSLTPVLLDEDTLTGKPKEVFVDHKEFKDVNALIPKFQKDLEEFEKKLASFTKNKIDVYGGGDLGEYERPGV